MVTQDGPTVAGRLGAGHEVTLPVVEGAEVPLKAEEGEDVSIGAEAEGEDSLDAQVDKFLAEYEEQAKQAKTEGMDFRMMTRRFLREAGEDEEEEKPADDEADKPTAEDMDMGSFASDVMRLVENIDSLLEVKNTVLRRAANYLAKNYDQAAVDAFKEELLESHGVEIGQSQADKDDSFEAPRAAAAGPMGGGGGGGA